MYTCMYVLNVVQQLQQFLYKEAWSIACSSIHDGNLLVFLITKLHIILIILHVTFQLVDL